MGNNKKDNRKTLIALIVVMAIICGLLIGAIYVIVRNNIPVTDEELVSDAFCEMKKAGDTDFCFHIPKINRESEKIEEINKEIYDTLYAEYSENDNTEMHYEWGQKDDIVSIVVQWNKVNSLIAEYEVFNIDIDAEEIVTFSEVYSEYEISESEFFKKVKEAVKTYSENEKQKYSVEDQNAYLNDIIEKTLMDQSILVAIPYISSNGTLSAIVPAFTPGTENSHLHMIDLESAIMHEHINCDGNHEEVYPENYEPVVDLTNIVSDAFFESIDNYCFHIPKINSDKEGISEINKQIYDDMHAHYEEALQQKHSHGFCGICGMNYDYAVYDDYVSIRTLHYPIGSFFVMITPYTVSLSEGRILSYDEIYQLSGYDENGFFAKVKSMCKKYADERVSQTTFNISAYSYDYALSDENIQKSVPYINSSGQLCAGAFLLDGTVEEVQSGCINLTTGEVDYLRQCNGEHSVEPEDIETEETTTSKETENDEWKDMLTKYYWDGSVQSNTIYRFFEDGTYIEYYYPLSFDIDTEFYPELLEGPSTATGTYEIKNNKLLRYRNWDNEIYCTEFEWVSIDSERILDMWIKERCKDSEYIFYDTSWQPDSFSFPGDNSSYLKNTGCVTDENHNKTNISETKEAKIYTDYLLNGGFEEFRLYKDCYGYDRYDTNQLSKLDINSCLYDFDSDGTKELFLTIQNKNSLDNEAQALYTIKNGKVEKLLLEEKEFATAGYIKLYLKYDSIKKIPVVERYNIMKDSSAATFSNTVYEIYSAENGFSESTVTYESTWLQLNNPHGYYTEDIAEIKSQTDLYHIGETHFEYYQINGEFVEKSEFEKFYTRYTDSLPSELTLRDGTYKLPIK